jgi:hypothetical protein
MNKKDFLKLLRNLIAEGHTEKAIDLLHSQIKNFSQDFSNEIIMLSNQFVLAKNQYVLKGVIQNSEFGIISARVNIAILEIADKIEKKSQNLNKKQYQYKINSTSKKNESIIKNNWEYMYDKVLQWIINDQIINTGGWGQHDKNIIEFSKKIILNKTDAEEGGVFSTFSSLRALKNYYPDTYEFRLLPCVLKAEQYFLNRQSIKGGFGRFISSRSGIELHTSVRHTAFAVCSLIDISKTRNYIAIEKGIKYILQNYDSGRIDDSCPSEAFASLLYLSNHLSQHEELLENDAITTFLNTIGNKVNLLTNLANQLQLSSAKPFWRPYGDNYFWFIHDFGAK